jgi:hypothetical protein
MNTRRWQIRRLATLCCAVALLANGTQADELTEGRHLGSSLAERVSQLESELATLYQQNATGVQGHESGPACSNWGGCCNPCCWNGPGFPCGWYAGGEFIYMQPQWKAFDAFTLTANPPGGSPTATTVAHEYDYDETFRLWAGYTGCSGVGVRVSWWELDHDSDTASVTVPAGGGVEGSLVNVFFAGGFTFSASQSLELQTLDFEVTNC